MDILKVKADQLTKYEGQDWSADPPYACLPYTLSLVSNLEVKTSQIYVLSILVIYIL